MYLRKAGTPIHFYGEEYASIETINGEYVGIRTLDDLFRILLKSWCCETAYPSCQKEYIYKEDPTYGQCAITATLVYDLFGGTIHKIRVEGGGTHYFNKVKGHYIDLTKDQFDLYNIPVTYEPNQTVDREYCGKNEDTLKRFLLLKKKVEEQLK